jgi:hypothetical protein
MQVMRAKDDMMEHLKLVGKSIDINLYGEECN